MDREPYSEFELRRQAQKRIEESDDQINCVFYLDSRPLSFYDIKNAFEKAERQHGANADQNKVQKFFWLLSKANELNELDESIKKINVIPITGDENVAGVEIIFSTITNIGRTHDFHKSLFDMLHQCDAFTTCVCEPYCVGMSFMVDGIWQDWG